MSGTKEGAKKASETRRRRYGNDAFSKMGAKSWQNPLRDRNKQPFAADRELASRAGKLSRKKQKQHEEETDWATFEEIHAIAEAQKDSSEAL